MTLCNYNATFPSLSIPVPRPAVPTLPQLALPELPTGPGAGAQAAQSVLAGLGVSVAVTVPSLPGVSIPVPRPTFPSLPSISLPEIPTGPNSGAQNARNVLAGLGVSVTMPTISIPGVAIPKPIVSVPTLPNLSVPEKPGYPPKCALDDFLA